MAEFCGRMASRPTQLDWETATMEQIQAILSAQRNALKRVFDLEGGQVVSREEFRDGLVRLGLGISTGKCDLIFDRVDVAGDGAIQVKEFVAFVSNTRTPHHISIYSGRL